MSMTPKDRKIWAKEQLLEYIDIALDTRNLEMVSMEFDDRRALEIERDRIAKYFNLATKYGG